MTGTALVVWRLPETTPPGQPQDGLVLSCLQNSIGDDRYPAQQRWLLRGPAGVVVFHAGRHRADGDSPCALCLRFRSISHFDRDGHCWNAWDLGVHSRTPLFDGQDEFEPGEDCYLLGAPCYYDGSSLQAGEVLDRWLALGRPLGWLRTVLARRYREWLETDEEVVVSPVTLLVEAMTRSAAADTVASAEALTRGEEA